MLVDVKLARSAQTGGASVRVRVRSVMPINDDRALKEKRAYYRLLRHLLSEKLKASYKEYHARPLPPRLTDLLKKLEYRKPIESR
jgi:hypothetical protein